MAESANPGDARSVLITGSSSGIGRALAERFAGRGWRVFASMRNPERGADLRARAAERGWRLTTPALDVTSDDSVAAATADILRETGGRLDVLVNNAGYYQFGALEETSPDELRAQLETNVVGVLRMTRAVLPAMRARRSRHGRDARIGVRAGRGPDRRAVPRVEVGAGGDDRGAAPGADPVRRPGRPDRARAVPYDAARQRTPGGRPGAAPTAPTPTCWRATGGSRPSCRARTISGR